MGAGNSTRVTHATGNPSVYPRGCGELYGRETLCRVLGGLSPWVRGTRLLPESWEAANRFIPVGAGNSCSRHARHTQAAVYPRGCGELFLKALRKPSMIGLSPWVRGTLFSGHSVVIAQRFIPVGAGNSLLLLALLVFPAVYPRGCGELFSIAQRDPRWGGLSPWVRGTLFLQPRKQVAIRFIPVGAGNSARI